jgi:sugar lactone lactonase YvrE
MTVPTSPRGRQARTILDGLIFPESPRWHANLLWVSDMFGCRVLTADTRGVASTIAEFDDNPSGLGFLPGGEPILALRHSRQIVRLIGGSSELHLDLASTGAVSLNDMVVDGTGRAFVGCIMRADRGVSQSDQIVSFDADGSSRVAASGLAAPNGMAVSPDGRTLIVAATWQHRLVAMTVREDGFLVNCRLRAVLSGATPDGVCMDAEGAIWLGGLASGQFVRVMPDGRVTDTVDIGDRWAIACVLGGADRTTLFMTVSETSWPVDKNTRGFILAVDVEVPGAGWP